MKIILCANATIRDNGTFCYARRALKTEVATKRDTIKWYQRGLPFPHDEEADLWLFVDDGRDDIEMDCPKPNACWLIDTHLGWEVRYKWAKQFDTVFTAQRDGAEKLRNLGVNAHWLPLACHPPAHPIFSEQMNKRQDAVSVIRDPRKTEEEREEARDVLHNMFMDCGLEKEWDVVFVGYINKGVEGHPLSKNRLDFLGDIFEAFPNSWIATDIFHEYMATRYIKGRLGFNVSILNDLNMRFFEVMSTGTALLTNVDVEGWSELGFKEGVHFIGYGGADDAIKKIHYYLEHPEEREAIAKAGNMLVRSEHTYAHRLRELLSVCGVN